MKNVFLLLSAVFLITACTSTEKAGFKVEGDVQHIDGMVYLTALQGKQPVKVDSAEVTAGKFQFKGTIGTPVMARIEAGTNVLVTFFLEDSDITVSGDANDPESITVTGSATQDLYQNYLKEKKELAASVGRDSAGFAQQKAFTENFVRENPNSVAAAYVLYREISTSYSANPDQLEADVARFAPEINNSVYLNMVNDRIEKLRKTAIGQPFIEINQPDPSGNNIALSSVVGPGKYVLVDFWASWCPPCRAENPHVVAAYKKYHPKGFEIYGVSLDRDADAWKKGIEEDGLTWINVSDVKYWDAAPAKDYGVNSIPANFLIDPDGKIIAKNLRGDALSAKLAEVLK